MSINRILIVEDNQNNMTLIADILDSLQYDVIKAKDGEQGVTLASNEHPDLILMDLSLPLKDGWQATRELKSSEHTRHVPVVALTAHALDGDREKALAAGCDDYLSKPIDLQELDHILKKYLG